MDAHVRTLSAIIPLKEARPAAHTPWKRLELCDIEFQHSGSSITITVPHFELQSGDRVFLSGPSGEGKTTILSLLAGWLHPQKGTVRLDGETADRRQLQQSALIGQDGELFNLSVRENVTLGRTIEDSIILTMLEELRLGPWLASLRSGLDTIIGERGTTVSQGQKQRLMLIRAALLARDTYLLDEPTSHLDAEAEGAVEAFIARHMAGKTVVIASHRASLAKLCERALTIRNHRLEG